MTEVAAGFSGIDDNEYRRRIRAWTLYDWANSAFATTILAAVLPVYYSQVAGRSLGSTAQATATWTATLSISLVIVAVLSPVLGTISDLRRAKKPFLTVSVLLGSGFTALLVFVGSGDWFMASALFIVARIGFAAGNVFYDALLPHVAKPADVDRVSTLGYAVGYLGGGLLLAVNVAMILVLGSAAGARLSFLSVALWWLVFSIPIFRRVPEPPAAVAVHGHTLSSTFRRLGDTFGHLRRYRELLKFLIAFLIYNDGIGTIIGVAAIYGAELGFGAIELVAAILLVQFVGIPFSLVFGRIPSPTEPRRAFFLAFVVWNLVMIPLVGIGGKLLFDDEVTGRPQPPFSDTLAAVGEGDHAPDSDAVELVGDWNVGGGYATTSEIDALYQLSFNGEDVRITYSEGPDRSNWEVLFARAGQVAAALDDDGEPVVIAAYNPSVHEGVEIEVSAPRAGEQSLLIVNSGVADDQSSGTVMAIGEVTVLPPARVSSLPSLLGLLVVVEIIGLALAALLGRPLFDGLAATMTTKRTIILSLVVYAVIAVWGFLLDSVIEFWFLAFMVAVVQGGSQALSRSLYASMSPTALSGEFFGFFSVMSKFSAIIGPLLFTAAVAIFDSSRPAVLGVIVFFVAGIVLLSRVDEISGRAAAVAADEAAAEAGVIESG
jgi:MFS transporter, UMF1 family